MVPGSNRRLPVRRPGAAYGCLCFPQARSRMFATDIAYHCPPRAVARRASPAVLSAPGSMPRQKYPTPRVRGPHAFRRWISSGPPRRRVDGRQPSRDAISHSGRYVVSDHRVVLLSFRHPISPSWSVAVSTGPNHLKNDLPKKRSACEQKPYCFHLALYEMR